MTDTVVESAGYAQITATGNVYALPAALDGIFVSSATSGTITVYDDTATGTTRKIVDTFTVAAGTFYKLPFRAMYGLYIVLGGTVSCTVSYAPQSMMVG